MWELPQKATFAYDVRQWSNVSFNPELRVASCGKTPEEAKKNLPDAIRGFLLSAQRRGTLGDILEETEIGR